MCNYTSFRVFLAALFIRPTLALFPFTVGFAAATPEVQSIYLDVQSKEITIHGQDFGSGPNILVFDTFESGTAEPGTSITRSASVEGAWTNFNSDAGPSYTNTSRSGNYGVKVFDGRSQTTHRLELSFDGTQEFFVSFWVYLEGSKYFPGDYVSKPRTFSTDSSYKMLWVYDQDVKGNSSDVVLPTHVGSGKFYLSGNDFNMVTDVGSEWWSWDNWMRISFWVEANETDPTSAGTVHFETLSADKGHKLRTYSTPVFDADGPELKVYKNMNFPGWIRSIQDSETNIIYDDIYVATGDRSAARIEVGNAETLPEVTRLDLLSVNSWTEQKISGAMPTLDKDEINNIFLYITTANGETNQRGIPIFTNPPSAPIVKGIE